jgi:hypothetical protein
MSKYLAMDFFGFTYSKIVFALSKYVKVALGPLCLSIIIMSTQVHATRLRGNKKKVVIKVLKLGV